MIQLVYLDDPDSVEYQEYIRKGVQMVYDSKVVPEQLVIPQDVTLDKILRGYRNCVLVAIEDVLAGTMLVILLALGEESPHVVGDVATCAITVGNTNNPKLGIELLRVVKRLAKASGHSWLQVHHRIAEYTYKAKYYKV